MINLNLKKIIVIMLIAAVAEVSATAFLVNILGVVNLIAVYVLTTSIGGFFVFLFYARQKNMFNKARGFYEEDISERKDDISRDPRALYFAEIGMAVGTFYIAVALIVIPGVVTDFMGLALLFTWICSDTVRNFDPEYEPKP